MGHTFPATRNILTSEQITCLTAPRDVEAEKTAIAHAKVRFDLYSLLATGRLSDIINGKKEGKFWVTANYRIVAESHVRKSSDISELKQILNDEREACKDRAAMLVKQMPQGQALVQQSGLMSQYPPTELDQCRQQLANIAHVKQMLSSMKTSYPFGLVLDNVEQNCQSSCPLMPQNFTQLSATLQYYQVYLPECRQDQCPAYQNYRRLFGTTLLPLSLEEVYAQQRGLRVHSAMNELVEKLDIDVDDILSAPTTGYEKGLTVRKTIITEEVQFFHQKAHVFLSETGAVIGVVEIALCGNGHKQILPRTLAGLPSESGGALYSLPFRKPYPLLNWDLITSSEKNEILLTDCIDLAVFLSPQSQPPNPPSERVWTSWYGGKDAVPDVNWRILQGRRVSYVLTAHSGMQIKESYRTALDVIRQLQKVRGIDLGFVECSLESQSRQSGRVMTREEFLESAREIGLAGKVNRLMQAEVSTELKLVSHNAPPPDPWDVDFLLPPFLIADEVAVLHGMKEAGKTLLAVHIALAVATGHPIVKPWGKRKPGKVLYLDGEMGGRKLAGRIASGKQAFLGAEAKAVPMKSYSGRLKLYTEEGRKQVDQLVCGMQEADPAGSPLRLLVIDNLTSMVGGEDKAKEWDEFFSWARGLNGQGITVLILHHTAGKNRQVKGTGMKVTNADSVIHLESLRDEAPEDTSEGLPMRVVLKHGRNNPFSEAKIPIDLHCRLPKIAWSLADENAYVEKILKLQAERREEMDDKDMGVFWGLPKRSVTTLRKKYGIGKYSSKNIELRRDQS